MLMQPLIIFITRRKYYSNRVYSFSVHAARLTPSHTASQAFERGSVTDQQESLAVLQTFFLLSIYASMA